MPLFTIQSSNAKKIPPTKVELEKTIQKIFEKNLNEILNITFLESERTTSFGGRIDTLGIDNNNSPVIIEYKRNQDECVINQALSYLYWLLDHKESFEDLVRKRRNIKANEEMIIDWDSPRVICIAERYNKFDVYTAALLPIRIELLKFLVYQEGGILSVEPEVLPEVDVSISKIVKSSKKGESIEKKDQHTLEDHLKKADAVPKKIFEALNEKIVALDSSIRVEPKGHYIAYKLTTNFADIVVMKTGLKIFLNVPSGKLKDPPRIARDLTKPQKIGHWGNGDYEVKLEEEDKINQVFELIKQSYEYNR